MRLFIFLIVVALFLAPIAFATADSNLITPNCKIHKELNGQRLYKCRTPQSPHALNILELTGTVEQNAYYHGLFLAKEAEEGAFKGVKTQMGRSLDSLDAEERSNFLEIKKCVISQMKNSSSKEFHQVVKNLHKGFKDGGSKLTLDDVYEASLSVELSIFVESLQRNLERYPEKTKRHMMLSCGPRIISYKIGSVLKKIISPIRKLKMGCTGYIADGTSTVDGSLIHGRNFDTGLLGFYEKFHTVVIQNLPNNIRSVGIATAGLHFAGGVSGFNNHGISISLHQLSTENTKMNHDRRSSDTTPFVADRIIREAKSIDQAITMIQERKGFGAWTVLIADSKTQEAASVEVSGDRVVVSRKTKNESLAQSNHYLSPLMKDVAFEYSYNKTLESNSRFQLVKNSLAKSKGVIDFQWGINMLSGHDDYFVGLRSFGRTTTKVYTAASHVMIPDRQELWLTLGETYPTNQGHFLGIRLQNKNTTPEIIGQTMATRYSKLENWYASQGEYVNAYWANEDNIQSLEQTEKTIHHLNKAIELATIDKIVEFPYYFLRARMFIYQGALYYKQKNFTEAVKSFQNAESDLNFLLKSHEEGLIQMHIYEHALVNLWIGRSESLQVASYATVNYSDAEINARNILSDLVKKNPGHYDLRKLSDSANKMFTVNDVLEDEIRFGTVE